jgi:hypothetical protein
MVVLSYCSPMEIQCGLQQPNNGIVDILAVVAIMDASNCTLYFSDEIREVALMDDRYVLPTVFDRHEFAYLQYQYFGNLCSGMAFLHILLLDLEISESMLISCGMDNKFVLAQNVMVDQESCE